MPALLDANLRKNKQQQHYHAFILKMPIQGVVFVYFCIN